MWTDTRTDAIRVLDVIYIHDDTWIVRRNRRGLGIREIDVTNVETGRLLTLKFSIEPDGSLVSILTR